MNRQKQIEYILEHFNFESVHAYMALKPDQWWKGVDGGMPSIAELRACANELLQIAAAPNELNCYSTSIGGFHAHRWPWISNKEEGYDCTLELIFSPEVWDA